MVESSKWRAGRWLAKGEMACVPARTLFLQPAHTWRHKLIILASRDICLMSTLAKFTAQSSYEKVRGELASYKFRIYSLCTIYPTSTRLTIIEPERRFSHGRKAIHIRRMEIDFQDFGQRSIEIWVTKTGIWLCGIGVVQHSQAGVGRQSERGNVAVPGTRVSALRPVGRPGDSGQPGGPTEAQGTHGGSVCDDRVGQGRRLPRRGRAGRAARVHLQLVHGHPGRAGQ